MKLTREQIRDKQCTGIWITREGEEIPVSEMGDRHLVNSIRLMWRAASKKIGCLVGFYTMCPEPHGEAAQDVFDSVVETVLNLTQEDILDSFPSWSHLVAECERRGISVEKIVGGK